MRLEDADAFQGCGDRLFLMPENNYKIVSSSLDGFRAISLENGPEKPPAP